MITFGIDPGAKGALAMNHNGKVHVIPFEKVEYKLALYFAHINADQEQVICCLEKVHAMPKQGSVSMFTFGENYGWIKGILDAYDIPYQEIPPQTWKKEFGLNSDKTKAIEVCKQLFPDVNLIPLGCRKPQDGMAEAVLMAEYARRKL